MHQLPATVWNQIAAETDLETPAARDSFPADEEGLEMILDNWAAAERQAKTPPWAVIPLMEVLPLMAEHAALTAFRRSRPEFLRALPEVPDAPTAAALMSRERQWSPEQSSTFLALLQSGQPLIRWQQSAGKVPLSA